MNMNKNEKNNRGLTEINLTSLVDVCLTLVIIFMVSYPLVMQSGINISTPSLEQATTIVEATELKAEVFLKEDEQIELNGTPIENGVLADSLQSLISSSKDKIVLISAEENVVHNRVVAVLDMAKQCGAEQLSIVKQK